MQQLGSGTQADASCVKAPPDAHVSAFFVRALLDVLRARGVSAGALLADQPALRDRLPLRAFQALLARGIELSGEPALGLVCGLTSAESSFGLMSPLVAHAASLRDALELLMRFQPLLFEGGLLRVQQHGRRAILRYDFPYAAPAREACFSELLVAGLMRLLRAFACPSAAIVAVCFEHAPPGHRAAYTQAFEGKERFSQSYVGIELSAALLDEPHLHNDPELVSALRAEAERALDRLLRPLGWTERVLRIMRRQPNLDALEAPCVASQFGLSDRSLRRHLRDEGASYRALACSVLRESACNLLRDTSLTIQHIAYEIGFADTTAFHRAFKRWTGLTPAEYRVCSKAALAMHTTGTVAESDRAN